jgi:hypothetical protein
MTNKFLPAEIKPVSLRSILMKMKILLFIALTFLVANMAELSAQSVTKTAEADKIAMIFPALGFQMPGGDMADRFGVSSSIGPGFQVKTKSNWIFGADINFIFGNQISEDSLIQNLLTVDGFVISDQGQVADLSFYERGFFAAARVGKVIPVFGSNPNSGIMITVGAGMLQHKIRIAVEDNLAAALRDDYKKGYDRLTNGFSTTQFIGYMHVGESRVSNFFAGFEFVQGWTKNRRSMNFDTMRRDDAERLDLLYGVKVGWLIPFRKRDAKDYYYY